MYRLAQISALIGANLLFLQLVWAARFPWLERRVGLDKLLRFHRWTGIIGYSLVLLHGSLMLIYFGQFGWDSLWAILSTPYYLLGFLTLLYLTLIVGLTLLKGYIHLPYHWWKRIHQCIYLGIIGGFIHSLMVGTDLASGWLRWYWIGLITVAGIAFLYRRILIPFTAQSYRVVDHQVIAKTVHHVTLEPSNDHKLLHQPGQFIFVQFQSQGITKEWHPFTVSSAPSAKQLTLSMKTSGDWTQTLDQLVIGSTAKIEGPYGRFSYACLPKDNLDYVFVAGGIGITPLHSMITELLTQSSVKQITLLYSARTAEDFAFKAEFDQLAAVHTNFKLVYVTGRIDQACLQKEVPTVLQQHYFICGPKPMMSAMVHCLRGLGVNKSQIHFEEFALN